METNMNPINQRETPITFSPQYTVLLVIDPVNDFLSEGGAGWEMTKSTVQLKDVVANIQRAIEGARRRGIPVIFGPMAYTEEDYADHELQRRCGINRIMFEKKMFLAGSWGADFHPDLQPLDDEIVLLPHKGCDVFRTDLPSHLERLGTTHLVIAGMAANLCCEATGRRATEEGFDVTFLGNAIGAESIPAYEASVLLNYPLIGNAVMDVEEFLAGVEPLPSDTAAVAPVTVQPGDKVRGSDHLELGVVKQVVAATEAIEGHIVVPRGLIFKKDTYIPHDAVVRRAGSEVFINVPTVVAGNMPWGEPPTRSEQEAKRGPRAQDVETLYGSHAPSFQDSETN